MSDLREKVAAKLAETIYDWENTHRTTTRAMTDDEFIQYSSEVLADAAISICMEEAAAWHEKNARVCREIANDDPRVGADARAKAKIAASHHDASAVGIRRIAIRSLKGGDGAPSS